MEVSFPKGKKRLTEELTLDSPDAKAQRLEERSHFVIDKVVVAVPFAGRAHLPPTTCWNDAGIDIPPVQKLPPPFFSKEFPFDYQSFSYKPVFATEYEGHLFAKGAHAIKR